jgi:hypothetical protein
VSSLTYAIVGLAIFLGLASVLAVVALKSNERRLLREAQERFPEALRDLAGALRIRPATIERAGGDLSGELVLWRIADPEEEENPLTVKQLEHAWLALLHGSELAKDLNNPERPLSERSPMDEPVRPSFRLTQWRERRLEKPGLGGISLDVVARDPILRRQLVGAFRVVNRLRKELGEASTARDLDSG